MNWQDVRLVLALHRHQALGPAAESLRMDPTTLSRRVTAFEEALGTALFLRSKGGWRLTDSGHTVILRAERIAAEMRHLEHELDASRDCAHGKVRLTAPDEVIARWLVPEMAQLRARYPKLQLELYNTSATLDLIQGQADLAVRLSRPKALGLRVKRLCRIELVLAATAEVANLPLDRRPVLLHGFLHHDGPENRRLRALGGQIVASATSLSILFQLVEAGAGISAVPRAVAERAGLTVLEPKAGERTLWRASPEAISDMPRIKAVSQWLDETLTERLYDRAKT